MPSDASEAVLEALLERGLAPFAPWYAAKVDYAWQGGEDGMLGTGYRVHLPRAISSGLALIGGPDGAVIANVNNEPGTLALSAEVARSIGIGRGREATITVIALRQLSETIFGSRGRDFGEAASNVPVPRPRPQYRAENIMPPVPVQRPVLLSP